MPKSSPPRQRRSPTALPASRKNAPAVSSSYTGSKRRVAARVIAAGGLALVGSIISASLSMAAVIDMKGAYGLLVLGWIVGTAAVLVSEYVSRKPLWHQVRIGTAWAVILALLMIAIGYYEFTHGAHAEASSAPKQDQSVSKEPAAASVCQHNVYQGITVGPAQNYGMRLNDSHCNSFNDIEIQGAPKGLDIENSDRNQFSHVIVNAPPPALGVQTPLASRKPKGH